MNNSKSNGIILNGNLRRAFSMLALALITFSIARAKTDKPSTALINRDAIVYCAAVGKIYAVDKAHGAVISVKAPGDSIFIKTGSDPEAIAVNNRTGMVYVVNGGSHSVSVIDGKTDTVIATVATSARPYAIAVDEVRNRIYVSNIFSDEVNVIDGVANTVRNFKIGSFDAIVVDEQKSRIYLLGYESDKMTVLDADTNELEKLPAGATHLWGIALTTDTLYITHVQDDTIAAIDTRTYAIKNLRVGAMPSAVTVDPHTGEIYVANYNDGSVTRLGSDAPVTIAVGKHPQAIAVDPEKKLVYVANTQESTVSVIDVEAHRVVRTVDAGEHPYAIAIDRRTHVAYVANLSGNPFTQIGKE